MIKISPSVKNIYPEAKFGAMIVSGIDHEEGHSCMTDIITKELQQLRQRYCDYDRKAILQMEPLRSYAAYYKKFGKTYHVLGQLESVVQKGKGIPSVGTTVEAMFLAEIKNMLLTAGHDGDLISGDLTVDVADEPLYYQGIAGKKQQLVQQDLYLSDREGILSSIIKGPDYRTRLTGDSKRVLYFTYGVEGVGTALIRAHLDTIFSYLSQVYKGVEIESIDVL